MFSTEVCCLEILWLLAFVFFYQKQYKVLFWFPIRYNLNLNVYFFSLIHIDFTITKYKDVCMIFSSINYLNNNNIFPKNPTGSDDIDSLSNIIKVLNQKENNDYGDARDIVNAWKNFYGLKIN